MHRVNLLCRVVAFSAIGSGFLTSAVFAADAITLQIPAENVTYFDAASHEVRVQLVKPSGVGNRPLNGTKVIVVGSDGATTTAVADDIGSASIKLRSPGWYSVLVSNPDGHAAVPFVVREMGRDTLPSPKADANLVKIPMMELPNAEALRINRSYLPMTRAEANEVDGGNSDTEGLGNSSHYRFALGSEDSVSGQLATITDKGMVVAGAGNNILVYRNGRLIYRSISDELGKFTIKDVPPGVYGLVAVGQADTRRLHLRLRTMRPLRKCTLLTAVKLLFRHRPWIIS